MVMNNPTTALIDGDMLIFKAGFANQKTEHGEVISVNEPHFAYKTVKDMINNILLTVKCEDFRIFIGDSKKSNFRYSVAKTAKYKDNRSKQKRPVLEKNIRNYLFKHWGSIIVKGIEVDDALGIEQDKVNGSTIICSNDKDLAMIPGWHYDVDAGKTRTVNDNTYTLKAYKKTNIYYVTDPGFLSLREANNGKKVLTGAGLFWFCAQLLIGDKTDNIPGLYKLGNVGAYNILKNCSSYEQSLKVCYTEYVERLKEELDEAQIEERFKEVAQLLWIKRAAKETIFPSRWLYEARRSFSMVG
jgi:5'-3' exonuclease